MFLQDELHLPFGSSLRGLPMTVARPGPKKFQPLIMVAKVPPVLTQSDVVHLPVMIRNNIAKAHSGKLKTILPQGLNTLSARQDSNISIPPDSALKVTMAFSVDTLVDFELDSDQLVIHHSETPSHRNHLEAQLTAEFRYDYRIGLLYRWDAAYEAYGGSRRQDPFLHPHNFYLYYNYRFRRDRWSVKPSFNLNSPRRLTNGTQSSWTHSLNLEAVLFGFNSSKFGFLQDVHIYLEALNLTNRQEDLTARLENPATFNGVDFVNSLSGRQIGLRVIYHY